MVHSFSWDRLQQVPIVGILRNIPRQKIEMLVKHFYESGLTTLEVTMNSQGAAETIATLNEQYGDKLNIGAGTVLTIDDLGIALKSGAQFIVTPVLVEDVIAACVEKKIPVFPGAYTPTEIYKACKLGADMIKVFPATRLGAAFIKEVMAPMNFLKLLPTGGITIDNCQEFLSAGSKALGLGSNLFPKELIETEQWDELNNLFTSFVERVQSSSFLHNS